ncbi:MAG: phosphodiesterase [Eubacteriales bacterium]
MKFMIASDIHGSAYYCKQMLDALEREGANRLILLGDLLYHGPRNDLPREYAPKSVIAMLNGAKERLLCVRGNCDTEVDQMVLDFPILADYMIVQMGNRTVYATHGHKFGPDHLPPLCPGDALLFGHTHIPFCERRNGILCLNPGSVSIPKENSAHGYMTMDEDRLIWKTLDGETVWERSWDFGENG